MSNATNENRIYLYDSTLRDGAQTQGVDFTPSDKQLIARELDAIGIDFIEGGWPGANPTDDAFFAAPPELDHAQLTVFGMTRRAGRSADNDPGLSVLLRAKTEVVCLFGKTWDFHVKTALGIELEENLAMIRDSIEQVKLKSKLPLFDCEHFFDGYKSNPEFATACAKTAYEAGARWIVMCDTNGGTLPHEVDQIVREITRHIPGSHLGIHAHNDTGNAVANSLTAVRAGVRQIQGTLNGLGERCGNANLISLIPTLTFKMGFETGVSIDNIKRLTHLSRLLDDRLNRQSDRGAPYVGQSAFAHKGGVHASAVEKDPTTYEHIAPEVVGNQRKIVVSDQSGRANILSRFREIGLEIDPKAPQVSQLVETVKEQEFNGYAYDGAEASFELLARRILGTVPDYFHCNSFRVIDERRWNVRGDLVTLSEATVKLTVGDQELMTVAEGNGPVSALDSALRKVLTTLYPQLENLRLVDYKVRILTPGDGINAITRVMIESTDGEGNHWTTVGVSANIIDASYNALRDSIVFKLLTDGVSAD